MLIKFFAFAACFFTCSYGLLNCDHCEARNVTLIYGPSVIACDGRVEKLQGCILGPSVFDSTSRVFFVPVEFMRQTYRYIWNIFDYEGDFNRLMFEDPERMYEDCPQIADLISDHYSYQKVDKLIDHFKTAYKSSMPDGEIPEIMVPEILENETNKTSDDHDANDYYFCEPERVSVSPIYNISQCHIKMFNGSETYFVHSNMSMHLCNSTTHELEFETCSNTSSPKQILQCLDIKQHEIDAFGSAINESTTTLIDERKHAKMFFYMKLREVWEARTSCMESLKKLRQRGWKSKFVDCFSDPEEFEEILFQPGDFGEHPENKSIPVPDEVEGPPTSAENEIQRNDDDL